MFNVLVLWKSKIVPLLFFQLEAVFLSTGFELEGFD